MRRIENFNMHNGKQRKKSDERIWVRCIKSVSNSKSRQSPTPRGWKVAKPEDTSRSLAPNKLLWQKSERIYPSLRGKDLCESRRHMSSYQMHQTVSNIYDRSLCTCTSVSPRKETLVTSTTMAGTSQSGEFCALLRPRVLRLGNRTNSRRPGQKTRCKSSNDCMDRTTEIEADSWRNLQQAWPCWNTEGEKETTKRNGQL